MKFDPRRAITGALLLAACAASGWALYALRTALPPSSSTHITDEAPDYTIRDFRATVMNEDGERKYTLVATLLLHYKERQLAQLTAPRLTQFREGQPLVEAQAEQGWLDDKQKQVVLRGNVRVLRGGGKNGRVSVTTTPEMRIFLK